MYDFLPSSKSELFYDGWIRTAQLLMENHQYTKPFKHTKTRFYDWVKFADNQLYFGFQPIMND